MPSYKNDPSRAGLGKPAGADNTAKRVGSPHTSEEKLDIEHSPLGASAAGRYIACPGSPRLIKRLHRRGVSTETDYSRKGQLAHKIGGFCLGNYQDAWETIGNEALWGGVLLPPDELQAVQKYINMARERIRWFKDLYKEVSIFVEFPMHRPELHDLAWGTMDLMIVAGDFAEILDYKHGAGVTVEARRNPQLMMYGGMAILDMPEIRRIRMSLFQPRAYHSSGQAYRWFEMDVPDLMKWVDTELTPAMELADPRKEVDPDVDILRSGDHCQFCPAARGCPALRNAMLTVQNEARPPAELTNEELGKVFAMIPDVKRRIKALEIEATRRGLAGDPVPGTKIVAAIAHRAWKSGAAEVLIAKFGDAAWAPREILSPAQMEKLGKEAAELTKMHAFTPDNGYRVVPVDGKGKPVFLQKPAELYQKYLEDHPIE